MPDYPMGEAGVGTGTSAPYIKPDPYMKQDPYIKPDPYPTASSSSSSSSSSGRKQAQPQERPWRQRGYWAGVYAEHKGNLPNFDYVGFTPTTAPGGKVRTLPKRQRNKIARLKRPPSARWTIGASRAALRGGDTRLFIRNKRGKRVSYRKHMAGIRRLTRQGNSSPLYPYALAVHNLKLERSKRGLS